MAAAGDPTLFSLSIFRSSESGNATTASKVAAYRFISSIRSRLPAASFVLHVDDSVSDAETRAFHLAAGGGAAVRVTRYDFAESDDGSGGRAMRPGLKYMQDLRLEDGISARGASARRPSGAAAAAAAANKEPPFGTALIGTTFAEPVAAAAVAADDEGAVVPVGVGVGARVGIIVAYIPEESVPDDNTTGSAEDMTEGGADKDADAGGAGGGGGATGGTGGGSKDGSDGNGDAVGDAGYDDAGYDRNAKEISGNDGGNAESGEPEAGAPLGKRPAEGPCEPLQRGGDLRRIDDGQPAAAIATADADVANAAARAAIATEANAAVDDAAASPVSAPSNETPMRMRGRPHKDARAAAGAAAPPALNGSLKPTSNISTAAGATASSMPGKAAGGGGADPAPAASSRDQEAPHRGRGRPPKAKGPAKSATMSAPPAGTAREKAVVPAAAASPEAACRGRPSKKKAGAVEDVLQARNAAAAAAAAADAPEGEKPPAPVGAEAKAGVVDAAAEAKVIAAKGEVEAAAVSGLNAAADASGSSDGGGGLRDSGCTGKPGNDAGAGSPNTGNGSLGKSDRALSAALLPLFDSSILPLLYSRGWRVEHGTRPKDLFFVPPGVVRGAGATVRVDFFDSKPQVFRHSLSSPTLRPLLEALLPGADGSGAAAAAAPAECGGGGGDGRRGGGGEGESSGGCGDPGMSDDALYAVLAPLFESRVWPLLQLQGWCLTYGGRPGDSYFFPPGVHRGRATKLHVDYFDSGTQVLRHALSSSTLRPLLAALLLEAEGGCGGGGVGDGCSGGGDSSDASGRDTAAVAPARGGSAARSDGGGGDGGGDSSSAQVSTGKDASAMQMEPTTLLNAAAGGEETSAAAAVAAATASSAVSAGKASMETVSGVTEDSTSGSDIIDAEVADVSGPAAAVTAAAAMEAAAQHVSAPADGDGPDYPAVAMDVSVAKRAAEATSGSSMEGGGGVGTAGGASSLESSGADRGDVVAASPDVPSPEPTAASSSAAADAQTCRGKKRASVAVSKAPPALAASVSSGKRGKPGGGRGSSSGSGKSGRSRSSGAGTEGSPRFSKRQRTSPPGLPGAVPLSGAASPAAAAPGAVKRKRIINFRRVPKPASADAAAAAADAAAGTAGEGGGTYLCRYQDGSEECKTLQELRSLGIGSPAAASTAAGAGAGDADVRCGGFAGAEKDETGGGSAGAGAVKPGAPWLVDAMRLATLWEIYGNETVVAADVLDDPDAVVTEFSSLLREMAASEKQIGITYWESSDPSCLNCCALPQKIVRGGCRAIQGSNSPAATPAAAAAAAAGGGGSGRGKPRAAAVAAALAIGPVAAAGLLSPTSPNAAASAAATAAEAAAVAAAAAWTPQTRHYHSDPRLVVWRGGEGRGIARSLGGFAAHCCGAALAAGTVPPGVATSAMLFDGFFHESCLLLRCGQFRRGRRRQGRPLSENDITAWTNATAAASKATGTGPEERQVTLVIGGGGGSGCWGGGGGGLGSESQPPSRLYVCSGFEADMSGKDPELAGMGPFGEAPASPAPPCCSMCGGGDGDDASFGVGGNAAGVMAAATAGTAAAVLRCASCGDAFHRHCLRPRLPPTAVAPPTEGWRCIRCAAKAMLLARAGEEGAAGAARLIEALQRARMRAVRVNTPRSVVYASMSCDEPRGMKRK